MKNQIQLLLIAAVLFSACNKKSGNEADTGSDTTELSQPETTETATECYAYYARKDTATLHLRVKDKVVEGDLQYALFEKDRNKGTINGKLLGDTLVAVYTFMSEGVESKREVVFLKSGNDWVEGFGAVSEKDGMMTFQDRSKLKFDNGLQFKAVACD